MEGRRGGGETDRGHAMIICNLSFQVQRQEHKGWLGRL